MPPVQDRAGAYFLQPAGYRAFIPKPLPPDPPVQMNGELWTLLSQADRALGRLDGSTETLPNPDLFVYMYVRKEAVLSSQIEGTQASLIDVLEFEQKALEAGRPQDVAEVVNYVDAMNFGLQRVKELPLSLRLIREIHAHLLGGEVRGSKHTPGEFRHSQNWIGPAGSTLETAAFVPPPPEPMQKTLKNLEQFLHDSTPMPILIKVGLVHAQFETIHPFLDGNGRVGRLLITFLLCERTVLQRPLLYLSYYFKRRRTEYYDRLQAIRDHGDWEGWLRFFLRGVFEVAQEAAQTARKIVSMREDHRQLIMQQLGRRAGKALTVLDALYQQPIVSVETVQEIVSRKIGSGASFSNANDLIKQFAGENLKLLQEITGRKRNRQFAYQPYLALFEDSELQPPKIV